MQKYDPMVDPAPEWWLSLDEDERISVVLAYHRKFDTDIPDMHTHSLMHAVIENQVAMGEASPTAAVLHRLINEKLDRHDAIHAIASVFINHVHDLLRGDDDGLGNDAYYAALEELTAAKWLRGDYGSG